MWLTWLSRYCPFNISVGLKFLKIKYRNKVTNSDRWAVQTMLINHESPCLLVFLPVTRPCCCSSGNCRKSPPQRGEARLCLLPETPLLGCHPHWLRHWLHRKRTELAFRVLRTRWTFIASKPSPCCVSCEYYPPSSPEKRGAGVPAPPFG